MTWTDLLFYCTFVSQIFLISYYFPEKILRRMSRVMVDYPPEEYPKLYPRAIEYYKIGHRAFAILSRLIFGLGFVILFAIYKFDQGTVSEDGFISEAWPAAYGIVQFLPLVLLELTSFSQFRRMRAANRATVRKAELRRRTLFTSVSPVLLGAAIALLVFAGLLELYANGFALEWKSFERSVWLIFSNVFMAAIGAWNLYGRKQDPHQAATDRDRQVKTHLSSMLYVSISISLFYMILALDEMFGLDYLDATLLSLYMQVVVLLSIGHVLRSQRIEEIDFDVYRSDPLSA